MRRLLIAAFLLTSCDGTGNNQVIPDRQELAAGIPGNVDLLALRVPVNGGRGRVLSYPALDTTVWSSVGSIPAIARVLSFDIDAGSLLYSDLRGIARALDFRLSAVSPATQLRLGMLATSDGWNVYGVSQDGAVGRSTPMAIFGGAPPAPWSFKTELAAREVFPLPNSALVVVAAGDSATSVYKLYPPDPEPVDSLLLPPSRKAFKTPTGDRIYLTTEAGVIGIGTRQMELAMQVRLRDPVDDLVTTPSGNQLFVRTDSSATVQVMDRYEGRIDDRIRFPSTVTALRMDPLGRFLIARAADSDTAYVVALSNYEFIRAFHTEWREDMPQVLWDGNLAVLRGRDVHFLDSQTLESLRTVRGGGADSWYFFAWNGFRPRAPGTTEPVYFPVFVDHNDFELPRPGTTGSVDSLRDPDRAAARADSMARADSLRRALPARGIFTVSFAVLRSDSAAARLARSIRVRNETARVVEAFVDATPIFRVVLGPYPSREAAEDVGRRSGVAYWVYEGPP